MKIQHLLFINSRHVNSIEFLSSAQRTRNAISFGWTDRESAIINEKPTEIELKKEKKKQKKEKCSQRWGCENWHRNATVGTFFFFYFPLFSRPEH